MDLDRIRARFRGELRTAQGGETLPGVTRWVGDRSEVVAFDLDERTVDAAIREQMAFFRGREFEWKVFSFDTPSDLRERLVAAGFEEGPREAVMVYDLRQGVFTSELEVRRVTSVEGLPDFRRVAEAVFRKDYSFTTGQLETAIREGQTGHDAYVGYWKGEPVAVGRLYTDPASQFAGLYGGGTLAAFRGKGFYRAVVAARAQDAASAGARYLQVDALPTSEPILRRMGFERLAYTWPCVFGG